MGALRRLGVIPRHGNSGGGGSVYIVKGRAGVRVRTVSRGIAGVGVSVVVVSWWWYVGDKLVLASVTGGISLFRLGRCFSVPLRAWAPFLGMVVVVVVSCA